ncbi:MAG: hypothetical protein GY862_01920 [Gammaproteobacteria bacterium]|nr:hypothetical protein [Gammaproteobacteria bacterium]
MGRLISKLRIGEKIGFGFGLAGMLFLGVIWQYHHTLNRSLSDYQHLQEVFEAKKTHALAIRGAMFGVRRAEKDFLLHKEERYAAQVAYHVEQVLAQARILGEIDADAAQAAQGIARQIDIYWQRFQAIAAAWREKGLNHNSGLQGAFRDAVHELEGRADHFKVGSLYLQLLHIRRGEKDLGLRRETGYRDRVFALLDGFREKTASSGLEDNTKAMLLDELRTYREAFQVYARTVLAREDIKGGKGPFRQAARRIEALLNSHYIPDLATNILQLRRREKDYLLRLDKRYITMALQELKTIGIQINASAITAGEKAQLAALLDNYRQNFLALAEQNNRIDRMGIEMRAAVEQIAPLIKENVTAANQAMAEAVREINASSQASARLMHWIVALATLLGIFFAVSITLGIARPLRHMAGILGRLANEESAERARAIPGARDEVHLMAAAVNTMADHKARFLKWWKASMRELHASRELHSQDTGNDMDDNTDDNTALSPQARREEAELELDEARKEKAALLASHHGEIEANARDIVAGSQELLEDNPAANIRECVQNIQHAGKSILTTLRIIARPADS